MRLITGPATPQVAETRQFLSFIWAGQNGFFELDHDPSHRKFWSLDDALTNLDGKTLFAPLARTRRRGKGIDVNPAGNVLWVDIDSRDAPERVQEQLLPLGLQPSVLVDSGNKGYWVYFKLTESISTDEIEALNRGLANLLPGDQGCWNRARLARLPNSYRRESQKYARIIDFPATSYPLKAFADISLPPPGQIEVSTDATRPDGKPSRPTLLPAYAILSPELWTYIRSRPQRGQGYDRSVEEQRIFTALIRQGWSDDEIIQFADQERLARHSEERQRRNDYSWTLHSIKNARSFIQDEDQIATTPPKYLSPVCEESATYQTLDRYSVLRFIHGQTTGALVEEITGQFGCSQDAVYRALRQLRGGGYVDPEREGKLVFNRLTPKGERLLDSRLRLALSLPTLEALKSGKGRRRVW